jgi:hypothetical protein
MRVSRILNTIVGCLAIGCTSAASRPSAEAKAPEPKPDEARLEPPSPRHGLVEAPAIAAAESNPELAPASSTSAGPGDGAPPAQDAAPAGDRSPARDELAIPRDWQRVEVDAISVPMPLGVEQRREATRLELLAREGAATYSLRMLEQPAQPITQNNVTAATLRVLGACTRNLRVSGVIERPGFFSSYFASACPSGVERQGRLIATNGSLFVLTVEAPRGSDPVVDPFLYGFEVAR